MPEASTALPLAGRTVLGIFAHPDDESLACGGTLARLADAGCRVVVVCASHGEAGSISDPALVPDGDRQRQLLAIAEHDVAASDLGQEDAFKELWEKVESRSEERRVGKECS